MRRHPRNACQARIFCCCSECYIANSKPAGSKCAMCDQSAQRKCWRWFFKRNTKYAATWAVSAVAGGLRRVKRAGGFILRDPLPYQTIIDSSVPLSSANLERADPAGLPTPEA